MNAEKIADRSQTCVDKSRGDHLLFLSPKKNKALESLRQERRRLIAEQFEMACMVDTALGNLQEKIVQLEQAPRTKENVLQLNGLKALRLDFFRTSGAARKDLEIVFAEYDWHEDQMGIHDELLADASGTHPVQ